MSFTLSHPAPSQDATHYVRLTLEALLWRGTFVAGRVVAGEFSPLAAAVMRFGLAAIGLLFLLRRTEGGLPRLGLRQGMLTALLGLSGVCLYNLFFFAALAEMPASRTALFVAFNPIAVALVGGVIARRFLPVRQYLGIGVALLRALIVITRGDVIVVVENIGQSFRRGELCMLAAVASCAGYTVLGHRALEYISPFAATTWAALIGFLLLVAFLFIAGPVKVPQVPSTNSILAIVYLAIGGTVVPFVWCYQGVRARGPERTAVFTNLVPVFGVLLGAAVLQESVGVANLAGDALVIAGVSLTNRC